MSFFSELTTVNPPDRLVPRGEGRDIRRRLRPGRRVRGDGRGDRGAEGGRRQAAGPLRGPHQGLLRELDGQRARARHADRAGFSLALIFH